MIKATSLPKFKPSPASVALKTILDEEDELSLRVRKAAGRTNVWKYSTNRGRPDAKTAAILEAVTEGQVAANAWVGAKELRAALAAKAA